MRIVVALYDTAFDRQVSRISGMFKLRFPVETVNTMRRIVEEAEHALVSEKVPA